VRLRKAEVAKNTVSEEPLDVALVSFRRLDATIGVLVIEGGEILWVEPPGQRR
jgi:hypothetical protein